jgi:hypothetical protein
MKSCLLLLLLMLCIYFPLKAQMNLVPNSSFEDSVNCPIFLFGGQINATYGWYSSAGSPDYLNSCSTNLNFSVPFNSRGFQQPISGNGYINLSCYGVGFPNEREAAGIKLTQPLTIGLSYYVSFFASLSDVFTIDGASSGLGVKFSTIPYSVSSPVPIDNIAHVYCQSIIQDSINWKLISGSFIADSLYEYINIGNFFDDQHTDTLNINSKSVYFIDQVCVSADSLYCDNWTSNHEIPDNDSKLNLFPNPVLSNLNITSKLGMKSIAVKNVFNRQLLYFEKITESSTIINLEELPSGIYIVEIDFGESILNRKIIKL